MKPKTYQILAISILLLALLLLACGTVRDPSPTRTPKSTRSPSWKVTVDGTDIYYCYYYVIGTDDGQRYLECYECPNKGCVITVWDAKTVKAERN